MRRYSMNVHQLGYLVQAMYTIGSTKLRQFTSDEVKRLDKIQFLLGEQDSLTFSLPYGTVTQLLEEITAKIKTMSSLPVTTNEDEETLGNLTDLKIILKRHFQIV